LKTTEEQKKELVEKFGVFFEEMGYVRMQGRVVGCLLLSEVSHLTFQEIQNYLNASKSSISTALNSLILIGLVDYFTQDSERKRFFKIDAQSWFNFSNRHIHKVTHMGQLIKECIRLRPPTESGVHDLSEVADFYVFLSQQLPEMLQKWEKQREKNKKEGLKAFF
jgi:DNA-binding transcriptional regulator GbsR (MarR family)